MDAGPIGATGDAPVPADGRGFACGPGTGDASAGEAPNDDDDEEEEEEEDEEDSSPVGLDADVSTCCVFSGLASGAASDGALLVDEEEDEDAAEDVEEDSPAWSSVADLGGTPPKFPNDQTPF